jgi:hypothetical protein
MNDILDHYFNDDMYVQNDDISQLSDKFIEYRFLHNKTYKCYALYTHKNVVDGSAIYINMLNKCQFIDDNTIQSFINAWIDDRNEEDMIGLNFSIAVSFYEIFKNEPYTDLFFFKECAVRDYILSCDRQLDLIPLKRLLLQHTDLH